METATDLTALTFEEALQALEQTVQLLDGGNLALEEALALFERGMRLARFCGERLDKAELRVREVQAQWEADDDCDRPDVEG